MASFLKRRKILVQPQTEEVLMQKQPSERFFEKMLKEFKRKDPCRNLFFWCFLVDFAKFVRMPFLQNSTVSILLIIAVSIVGKRVLTNITVNYDTKTKAYVLIRARSVKLLKREVQVKEKVSEAVVRRLQIRCS